MSKRRVNMIRRNWDIDFYTDLFTGNGFIISDPPEISLDGVKKRTMHGPQSPLYGNIYTDEQSVIMRYRCQCGAFVGKQWAGQECPNCHTKVEKLFIRLTIHILLPLFLRFLYLQIRFFLDNLL